MGPGQCLMLGVCNSEYTESAIAFELIMHLHGETHLQFAVKFWNMDRTLNTYDLIISRNI